MHIMDLCTQEGGCTPLRWRWEPHWKQNVESYSPSQIPSNTFAPIPDQQDKTTRITVLI